MRAQESKLKKKKTTENANCANKLNKMKMKMKTECCHNTKENAFLNDFLLKDFISLLKYIYLHLYIYNICERDDLLPTK